MTCFKKRYHAIFIGFDWACFKIWVYFLRYVNYYEKKFTFLFSCNIRMSEKSIVLTCSKLANWPSFFTSSKPAKWAVLKSLCSCSYLRSFNLGSSHLRSNYSAVLKANNCFSQKFFSHSIKMLNLPLKEFILVTKNRNINGYKSMPKDKLLRIINDIKRDRKSLFKSKKEETKKILYKPTRNNLFKLKRE